MDNLELYIESLIFTTPKAITLKEIKHTLELHFDAKFKEKEIEKLLSNLSTKYADDKYTFEVIEIAGGYQFMTKGTYYPLIGQFLKIESKKKLSKAALETLAIISYKQPITKSGMESIRGVNCDYSVTKLLEKELIMISGRAEGPGRPLLYGTTEKFMNHFGLKTLNDLPKIKEFEIPDNVVGVQSDDLPEPSDPSAEKGVELEETEGPADIGKESAAFDIQDEEQQPNADQNPEVESQDGQSEAEVDQADEAPETPETPQAETEVSADYPNVANVEEEPEEVKTGPEGESHQVALEEIAPEEPVVDTESVPNEPVESQDVIEVEPQVQSRALSEEEE